VFHENNLGLTVTNLADITF